MQQFHCGRAVEDTSGLRGELAQCGDRQRQRRSQSLPTSPHHPADRTDQSPRKIIDDCLHHGVQACLCGRRQPPSRNTAADRRLSHHDSHRSSTPRKTRMAMVVADGSAEHPVLSPCPLG